MHCFIESSKPNLRAALVAIVLILIAVISGQPTAFAQDISVRAELSASTITRDESVVLTITATGIDEELDASSLGKDFDVVGRSSSRQVGTVIGSNNQAVTTSVITWALELLPKGEGIFTVPAVNVGNYETQLLSLTVNAVPQGAKRDIFLEASVDTTSPWVQSQVVMTLRVFQAIEIVDGGLDVPEADDLVVERLGEDVRKREIRDGREYSVTERRFALFPQKSGSIAIDPVTLSVTVPAEPDRVRGFFSPTRKLSRSSDPITLNVQARPPTGTGWWLPAQNVSLQAQWQGDPQAAQVDQPLTRTIVMRAAGVLDSQLPQISIPAIDGLSLYAEDPQRAMRASDAGLVSEQKINWALIPQRSGTLTLPAIQVEWFNTLTGEIETAELPSETIEVLAPAATGSDTASPSSATNTAMTQSVDTPVAPDTGLSQQTDSQQQALSSPSDDILLTSNTRQLSERISSLESSLQWWQIIAFAIVFLWGLTVAAGFTLHRRLSADSSSDPHSRDHRNGTPIGARINGLYQKFVPMNRIEKACVQGDILEIKRALLEWTELQWPVDTPTTLDALQKRLPAGPARDKLANVQSALYSKEGYSSIMPALLEDLKTLPDDLKNALQQSGANLADGHGGGFAANDDGLPTNVSSRLPQL